MQKEMNKKGQDLSIGTLILIVLGIVVLVLLILGFSLGWENLWEKINIFGGGTNSVNDVATACRIALSSQDKYTLCDKTWPIKGEGDIGCRDPRVLINLDKTENDLGCVKKCVPKAETFCTQLANPTAETCKDACKFTPLQGTISAKCELGTNAVTFCLPFSETDCITKVGCEFK